MTLALERATCQLLSGPDGAKCQNGADGVWHPGTNERGNGLTNIPLCRSCMSSLQEQFNDAWPDAKPEPFLVFWDD